MQRALGRTQITTWGIPRLLEEAQSGRLVLPAFQRAYRWEAADVEALFDSIYNNFPIGYLLIWETDRTPGSTARFGSQRFEPAPNPVLMIIDGQQRVTSLVASLLADRTEPDRRFRVYFDLHQERFSTLQPGVEPPPYFLPVSLAADTFALLEWLQSTSPSPKEQRLANEVVRAIRDYRIGVHLMSGPPDVRPAVMEVFQRINTTGKALTAVELFKALNHGQDDEGLELLRAEVNLIGFGDLDDSWLLKAVAATCGWSRPTDLHGLRHLSASEQARVFERAATALRSTIRFFQVEAGVPNWAFLPYRLPLLACCAFFSRFESPRAEARAKLRSWIWSGSRTQELSISLPIVSSTLERIAGADNDVDAANRLLDLLQAERGSSYTPAIHNSRTAGTKIVGCALAALNPRHLATGELVDIETLAATGNPYPQLVIRTRTGTHARILHPEATSGPKSNAQALIAMIADQEDDAVLASHLIDPQMARDLIAGREDAFLERREEVLTAEVNHFLARMCTP